ncbi:carbohydrate ABC transporter permease [Paenibacillus glucanolyticus]|jgi:putative aldouronate transport system permease protein|uniref:carbohydrate ABC transporter permease n=1 Tax=Paenibacillus TaxID=44249 RepID=UPI0003E1D577|nr:MULTISPECIES: carbohydrate ABC transporter permease [Paenibacillus]ANA78829.1 ABC transporter permease [Paenibacillus glucanolyticus]AVV57256.1 carbohydrate ABC transporter permease [Paenibacillus glucanolyticus]ETT32532.1 binding-protein-dependent transport system inner membrane protein [Paenibacillus sp. FSL R5-808]
MKHSFGYKFTNGMIYAVLSLIGLVTLLPFLYVIIISFTDPSEYLSKSLILIPEKWSFSSYRYILSTEMFIRSLGVSAFLAIVGSIISIMITSALSYSLSRRQFFGKKFFLLAILMTMLFNPGMIPNFLLVESMGLMDTIWSLILPAVTSAWYVFLMRNFYQELPEELEEAAKIDGSNDIGVFFKIMLPISLPAIAAFGLFFAVGFWNTYFNGVLYINSEELRPMQVVLQMMLIQASTNVADPSVAAMLQSEQMLPPETIKMAAVVVASLPIILVYPFLQKYFVKGMLVGSIKG